MGPAEWERKQIQRDKDIVKMKEILKAAGISLTIGGCGCCGSPIVEFKYKDFQCEYEDLNLDTTEE